MEGTGGHPASQVSQAPDKDSAAELRSAIPDEPQVVAELAELRTKAPAETQPLIRIMCEEEAGTQGTVLIYVFRC